MEDFNRQLSSVVTLTPLDSRAKLQSPEATRSHFYTVGRMLSYNIPNKNGLIFFQSDCEKVLSTLDSSLANVSHIKPGNDVADPHGLINAVCGAITKYHSDSEGIDIVVKNDRAAVNAMGFRETDFQPGIGRFAAFSQESDFSPEDSPWVTVPPGKTGYVNPSDIVDEYPYTTGLKMGLKSSTFDPTSGQWHYAHDPKGNVVFVKLVPSSFAGVGQVMRPADETAQIYTYAASVEGEKVIASLYPRVEDPDSATAQSGRQLSDHKEPTMADDLTPHLTAEIADLKERARVLSETAEKNSAAAQERDAVKVELDTLRKEFSEFKTAQEGLVTELKQQITDKDTVITEKDKALSEVAAKTLSQERLATLEAIHPFSTEEKTEDFVKSLSEVSEDRFETLTVRRELVKAQADAKANRSLSQVNGGGLHLSPAPEFDGKAVDISKLTAADLF